MSIRIGVTGGMGSGKTYVCQLLEKRGIPVFYTDTEAKRLIVDDSGVRQRLKDIVGNSLYNREGKLDKKVMASFLVRGKQWADQVNAVVHPAVRKAMYEWFVVQESHPIVVVECALLFESGLNKDMDKIVSVVAPLQVRLDRIVRRDGCTEEHARQMISLQQSDDYRMKCSDFVVENDGTSDILHQLDSLNLPLIRQI
ncbi:MAG: dephospho-CoA kinase [Bacteroidaceae bacterium]|nr:dephospho-CoA kinase [Bacteroidaceae bacterium]